MLKVLLFSCSIAFFLTVGSSQFTTPDALPTQDVATEYPGSSSSQPMSTGEFTQTQGFSPTGESTQTQGFSPTGESTQTQGFSPTGESTQTQGFSPTGESTQTIVSDTTPGGNPSPSGNCNGIIFIQEMTQAISDSEKSNFFGAVKKIAASVSSSLQFGFFQFGNVLYGSLQLTDYNTFLGNINAAEANFNSSNQPDGSSAYIAPPLNELLNTLNNNPGSRFAVLLGAEQENIRDPAQGNTVSNNIASAGIDVYVLDYSIGIIPFSLWNTLTGKAPNHVINGTDQTADQLFNSLQSTLINDINNIGC